jgi:hypothetical protein
MPTSRGGLVFWQSIRTLGRPGVMAERSTRTLWKKKDQLAMCVVLRGYLTWYSAVWHSSNRMCHSSSCVSRLANRPSYGVEHVLTVFSWAEGVTGNQIFCDDSRSNDVWRYVDTAHEAEVVRGPVGEAPISRHRWTRQGNEIGPDKATKLVRLMDAAPNLDQCACITASR